MDMRMTAPGILSKPLLRREDRRLLTGAGRFVDDVRLPGMLHIGVVRSPHAHAKILRIDKTDALNVAGVLEVIVPGDYPELDLPMPDILEPGTLANPYCDLHRVNPHHVLACGKTTFQGEPVAMVVAESRLAAAAGAQAVAVDYEELPAVTSAEAAMAPDAPRVHDGNPNIIGHLKVAVGDIDAAFANADFVIEERLGLQRLASMAIEGRGVVASWDAMREELTVWSTNQVPYRLRDTIARMMKLPYERVRIISGDIGGAFGGKGLSPEDLTVAAVSRRWRRPARWIESRSENFLAVHARDQFHDVRVAARNDGTLLGMDLRIVKDVGAYNSYEMVQTTNTVNHVLLHYKVPAFRAEGWCVVTNKSEMRPTRGAGRPEASFVMDRVLDFVAQKTGLDPLEVRLRNIIPADEMPYRNGLTYRDGVPITYDGGDYPRMLKLAAERFDYAGWRQRQQEAREAGRLIGIGCSSGLEAGGVGPCEGACVTLDDRGDVSVSIGVNSHGQSHETTFAQVCAEYLGVPFERVRVFNGDTRLMRHGYGTGASRVGVNTGNAVMLAALALRRKIGAFAAHVLRVAENEIALDGERAFVASDPQRGRSFAELARAAIANKGMIPLGGPGLTATEFFYPETVTWSSCVQMAAVEVDRETGIVGVLRYVVVHDCGLPMNPMVVDGQIQGGVVQGLGAALGEELVYDGAGQLLTGSFMDYPMPRAADTPPLQIEHLVYPTDRNPLGVRAAGEGGPVSPPAALAGAVEDALYRRCRIRRMPLTPQRVFELLREAELL
ncbi:MAG TPA: xanthine dehydrogenase family protein molybdopterin-binding subunit [Burkholderiaceae bacterium]|nr:xanthine dehydrogenase family protein molybdopterin-binding subunit [Burkholderiaceae bacterium]